MKYILMDVEGTTTSISFVHDILFPYSAKRMSDFVKDNESKLSSVLENVRATALSEKNIQLDLEGVINQLLQWIKEDRKHPALKTIQGMIWYEGYEKGELKGHVYEEVPAVLEQWKKSGHELGIYSSGSVEAQRALFGHSLYGNLNPYFSHNFDTQVGGKRETKSYETIAQKIKYSPSDILFLSDIKEELDAAKAAGFQTTQLVRLEPLPDQGHHQVQNFLGILPR